MAEPQAIIEIPRGELVQWCLISHTNIGKTTLTRTLLGQDVGDIRDAAHVTDSADAHVLVQTEQGDALTLWDTPGFGDSVRLYQRLRQQANPMGWLMSNIWDRWRDKPFWMSQRAMRAARDSADVVLYLVNAAEDPADAGYLDAEMHLLQWLGKPVIVLLNQLGTPQTVAQQEQDLQTWSRALARYTPMVRDVLALDAFTRSWIHEQRLFHVVQHVLAPTKQAGYQRLVHAWEASNQQRFEASMQQIAALLVYAAQHRQPVAEPGGVLGWDTLKKAIQPVSSDQTHTPEQQAMQLLLQQLQKQDQQTTAALLRLHQLDGRVAAQIHAQLREYFTVHQPLDSRQMGLLGALTTGAAGGLGADLAAGGLTMGAGAVLGALAGALTFAGAALGINRLRAQTEHQVELSDAFLDSLLQAAMLKYLAIAHFGRGRGLFTEAEAPAHWHKALRQHTDPRLPQLHALWGHLRAQTAGGESRTTTGVDSEATQALQTRLQQQIGEILMATMQALYPMPSHRGLPQPEPAARPQR